MTTFPEPDGIVWRTSSYTGANGSCVEVGWRTSSYTGNNGACVEVGWDTSSYTTTGSCVEVGWGTSSHTGSNGACVEVGWCTDPEVHVRDTKQRTGGTLTFPHTSWARFLATTR